MPCTVGANSRTVVHKNSSGITFAFPDVCLTPAPPSSPIPIPYPNIAQSMDAAKGAKKVKADGQPVLHKDSNFRRSTGDEAGVNKGIISGRVMGKAEFMTFSFDVKVEGKAITRALDMMFHNDKNTPPFPLIQPPLIIPPKLPPPPDNPKEWSAVQIDIQ